VAEKKPLFTLIFLQLETKHYRNSILKRRKTTK